MLIAGKFRSYNSNNGTISSIEDISNIINCSNCKKEVLGSKSFTKSGTSVFLNTN